MLLSPVLPSKIKSFSDEEKARLVGSLTHFGVIDNHKGLLVHGVSPELIMARLKPEDYFIPDMARDLVEAGVSPEEVLEHIPEKNLDFLEIRDRIALITDQTAERLIKPFKYIYSFVDEFLIPLNESGKKLPPDVLSRKINQVMGEKSGYYYSDKFMSYIEVLLDAGLSPDTVLDFVSSFRFDGDLKECQTLLKRGATPSKLVTKISNDHITLTLYGDLKKAGIEFTDEEIRGFLANHCWHLEPYLPSLIEEGISPSMIVEEMATIHKYQTFCILIEAGVSAKSLYDKMSPDLLMEHCADLEPYIDYDRLICQRVMADLDPEPDFTKFLAENIGFLLRHGVSQNLILAGFRYIDSIYKYLDDLVENLDATHLRAVIVKITGDKKSHRAFPAIVKYYDKIKEAKAISSKTLHRVAENWFPLLSSSDYYEQDIRFTLDNLGTIVEIFPELDLQELVNNLLRRPYRRRILLEYLETLMSYDIDKRGLARELAINTGGFADISQYTVRLLLDYVESADWFILNADDSYFPPARIIIEEEIKYYLSKGATPDLVAYLYLENNWAKKTPNMKPDEVVGQPTIWSKIK